MRRKKAKAIRQMAIGGGALAVAAIAAVAVLWLREPEAELPEKSPETVVKKVAKPKKSIARPRAEKVQSKPAPGAEKKQRNPREELREKVKHLSKEQREELALAIMKRREPDLTPKTNMPFRTGIELSMARIFMTRPGNPPPPLHSTFIPIQDAVHLEKILAAGNPVLESDNEEVRTAKQTVEVVKREMADFIKEGGTPEEFMSYYYDKLNSAFLERRDSIREVARIARTEPEIAQEFYEEVERKLKEKGIRGIEFNERQKSALGLR